MATKDNSFNNPEKISIAGCKNEGETVDNSKNQKCCTGLASLKVVKLGNGTLCSDEIAGYVCAKCGNKICGIGENKCNCAQDCGKNIDESAKSMTCNQACKELGYQSGYCNTFTWKQVDSNPDAFVPDPVNYCASINEDPLLSHRLTDNDCSQPTTNLLKAGDKEKHCCCKGKPQNSASCQQALGGDNSSCGGKLGTSGCDCVSDTGWLKNTKTGECCWYNGCPGGQDEWTFYNTLYDCENPCEFDKNKLACCRNGICNTVVLNCGTTNELDTDWITCDDQCKPVASCKPKTDIWDSCDKLCQKSNLGKVTDCIAGKGRSIVNPENGYGCCCEKTVCGQEGEKLAMDEGQQCCAGLKQIIVTNTGIDFLCINPANQKAGSFCESNDDCPPGYICLNNFSFPEKKCAKKPACAKEGEILNERIGQECCLGLKSIFNVGPSSSPSPDSMNICTKCGDGICGKGESGYNCPEDCGSPKPIEIPIGNLVPLVPKLTLPIGKCIMYLCSGNISYNGIDDHINIITCDGKTITTVTCAGQLVGGGHGDSSDPSSTEKNYACCTNLSN